MPRAYGAIAERHSTGELNDVTGTDVIVLLHERYQVVDRVADTNIGRVVGLNGREQQHRSVGSPSATWYN